MYMQTVVEDLSEDMRRESEEEMRTGKNAPSIAFFDLSDLSGTGSLLYILGAVGFFVIVFYILI